MKKIVIFNVFVLLIVSVSINAFSDDKNKLVGFWSDSFPVHDVEGGYYFFEDNRYIYITFQREDIKRRYNGSAGRWKVNNNNDILIKKEKAFFWGKKWILLNTGVYQYPKDGNSLSCKHVDQDWNIIGNIKYCKDSDNDNPSEMFFYNDNLKTKLKYWRTKLEIKSEREKKDIIDKRFDMSCK